MTTFNNVELEIDSSLCFTDNLKADILETEEGIICCNKKLVKLVNYGATPSPTSHIIVNLNGASHSFTRQAAFVVPNTGSDEIITINNPDITDMINYDSTGLILVGLTSYRAISYEIPSLGTLDPAIQQKEFVLPNIVNQGQANAVESLDIMRNQFNFLVADTGLGTTGVYRYSFGDEIEYKTMIIMSGIKVEKIKHFEVLNWISISKYPTN